MRPGVLVLALFAAACLALAAPPRGSAEDPASTSLSLPWEGGSVWRYAYGPHSGSSPVADALDFQPLDAAGKQCETFTSAFWAVAAADGRAIALQNAVEVDHGGGFRTGYFHLADKQVKTGDEVKAGQRLGRPGCCPDGGAPESCWSTDPHLHFYTVSNGARRSIEGTSIGGWVVADDGCLEKGDSSACPGASLISSAPRSDGSAPTPPLDVTVALDVSGSMRSAAEGGEVLRLVSPYLEAASSGTGVTIVAFNSHARVILRPGEEHPINELIEAVGAVPPEGNTDLTAGLSLACREMQAHGEDGRQALVLITDGVHNAARLREPQRCFAERGWPVFAYGVGRANAPLLSRIASMTGGEFRRAEAIFDPVCEMARLRTVLSALARSPCTRYLLRSGERLAVPFTVPPEQSQLALAVTWVALGQADEEPALKTAVRLPNGRTLAAETALSHAEEAGGERYAVASPAAGVWEAVISGSGLPRAGVLLSIAFGTTPVAYVSEVAGDASSGDGPLSEDFPNSALDGLLPGETLTPTPDASEEPGTTLTPQPTLRPRRTPTPTPSPSPTTSPAPAP